MDARNAPSGLRGYAAGSALLHPIREMALQDGFGRDIGLLQVDAPILELFERDRCPGDGTAHESARPQHAKIAVEVFDLGLSSHGGRPIGTIEHQASRRLPGYEQVCGLQGLLVTTT